MSQLFWCIKFDLALFLNEKIFDKNQDGFIDKAELKDVLTRLGENITDVKQKLFRF